MNRVLCNINEELIKDLENGNIPWRGTTSFPRNVYTGKRYFGISALWLIHSNKYPTSLWGDELQYKILDCPIDKNGFISMPLYSNRDFLFLINVYNSFLTKLKKDEYIYPNYKLADYILKTLKNDLKFIEGNECRYLYKENTVICPKKERFLTIPAFYDSIFHEIMHWTEDKTSLLELNNKDKVINEMRAEIGSAFLLMELGIPNLPSNIPIFRENVDKYLDSWLKLMKNDATFIEKVTFSATKAVDFLLKKRIFCKYNRYNEPPHG